MNSLIRKIGTVTISVALLSTVTTSFVSHQNTNNKLHNTAEAAGGWKYSTSKTGNTSGNKLAQQTGATAVLGLLGAASGGGTVAATFLSSGGFLTNKAISSSKTVYYTDKIYQRQTLQGPEFKHVITFYKNKAKTKKIGTTSILQKTVVKGESGKNKNTVIALLTLSIGILNNPKNYRMVELITHAMPIFACKFS
ncbi:hypothetical protein [Staphylococcus shinii]|uniref:hypothetical protein n=1 Tax=Staphylococcus shinii TaxID=2912228 RepID=UPI00298EFEC4|nr:hypothetical protein [Staphylococcus shinii]MDW8571589.1 hypothetical protein [Staphylococcus shinii]MDW8574369.1 hypothetical protein [Staphylococcus shinii]